jgi:DnaJ-class molecular chaperone
MRLEELIVSVRLHLACPLCEGNGRIMFQTPEGKNIWKHVRPCPICRGAGQIHERNIPTEGQIADAMINYKF